MSNGQCRFFCNFFFRKNKQLLHCLLFVCLYPINVKTTEPIGPKFVVGPRVIPGKVFKNLLQPKFDF